jgi:DNA-binding phage protein
LAGEQNNASKTTYGWLSSDGKTTGREGSNEKKGNEMALTRDFKETVQARVRSDPAFREGLLSEAIQSLLSGDVALGKELLRDYINATVGFPRLAAHTRIHVKTLHQMLGPDGNPTARNLFEIVAYLQRAEGVRFEVRSARGPSHKRLRPSASKPKRAASRFT